MKCKQCGWENPDTYDRCVKCNNVLVKPRVEETQTPGFEIDRTVADHTSVAYGGGYPGGERNQPYTNQPDNSRTYNGEPYAGQSYNGQPYNPRMYNNMQQSEPRQPFNPGYGQQPYDYSQQNLYGGMPEQQQYAPQPEPQAEERYCPECDAELPAGATECPVCHTKIQSETIEVVEGVCPDCGTEITTNQKFCGNCGTRLMIQENVSVEASLSMHQPVQPLQPEQQPQKPGHDVNEIPDDGRVTVEADVIISCNADDSDDTVAAGPLSGQVPECVLQMTDGSGADLRTICCAGSEVELYRGNTDPANNTIARDLQARLTFADGKWSIEDCSALQTTFIRPSRKIELRDGDVIVMGNREFMFKS